MKKRQRRLVTSLGALVVALVALAYGPHPLEATPFGCEDIGVCSGCEPACEVCPGCSTACDPLCINNSNYLWCAVE